MSFSISPETKKRWDKIDPNYNKSKLVESLIIKYLERVNKGKVTRNPSQEYAQKTKVLRRF